ncbi:MAG: hypothetical protein ACYCW6_12600 [Candidatus Xenobia bacterium]
MSHSVAKVSAQACERVPASINLHQKWHQQPNTGNEPDAPQDSVDPLSNQED